MLTKTRTPAEEKAVEAKEAVQAAEDELRDARQDLRAHQKDVERLRVDYDKWKKTASNPVPFGLWPSQQAGQERGTRTRELESKVRMLEDRVQLLQERASEAEKRAGPLSKAARARLEELASWAKADAELAEVMGANPCEILVSPGGHDRILAAARDHGIEVAS